MMHSGNLGHYKQAALFTADPFIMYPDIDQISYSHLVYSGSVHKPRLTGAPVGFSSSRTSLITSPLTEGVWRERRGSGGSQECGGRGRGVEEEAGVWRERWGCGGRGRGGEGRGRGVGCGGGGRGVEGGEAEVWGVEGGEAEVWGVEGETQLK